MSDDSELISELCKKAKKCREAYLTPEYFARKTQNIPFPRRIRIEPTNFCNIRCRICPTHDVPIEKKGFMSMSLFERIMDDLERIKSRAPFYVTLYIGGEPLMHKQICDMISCASSRGHYTHLNTNCMLLTEDMSEKLIRSGLDLIMFSFDDEKPRVVEEMRKGADYDRMFGNIKTFADVRGKLNASKPEMVVTALKIPKRKDKDSLNKKPRMSHDFVNRFKGMPVKILPNWAHHWASDFVAVAGEMVGMEPLGPYYPCKMLWGETSVRWDGTVIPCCYDLRGEQPLGIFPDKGLDDIWNSDEYVNLREAHISGRIMEVPLCRGCSMLRQTHKLDKVFCEASTEYLVAVK
jgi:MoaA/NifB/PqqE/SkfB family radical SAM enzyme